MDEVTPQALSFITKELVDLILHVIFSYELDSFKTKLLLCGIVKNVIKKIEFCDVSYEMGEISRIVLDMFRMDGEMHESH